MSWEEKNGAGESSSLIFCHVRQWFELCIFVLMSQLKAQVFPFQTPLIPKLLLSFYRKRAPKLPDSSRPFETFPLPLWMMWKSCEYTVPTRGEGQRTQTTHFMFNGTAELCFTVSVGLRGLTAWLGEGVLCIILSIIKTPGFSSNLFLSLAA